MTSFSNIAFQRTDSPETSPCENTKPQSHYLRISLKLSTKNDLSPAKMTGCIYQAGFDNSIFAKRKEITGNQRTVHSSRTLLQHSFTDRCNKIQT